VNDNNKKEFKSEQQQDMRDDSQLKNESQDSARVSGKCVEDVVYCSKQIDNLKKARTTGSHLGFLGGNSCSAARTAQADQLSHLLKGCEETAKQVQEQSRQNAGLADERSGFSLNK
jgi:hypothetical protein